MEIYLIMANDQVVDDRYGHTDTNNDIQQTETNTPFQNLYQTDTDICFEIHIKPIPIPIIGIYLY